MPILYTILYAYVRLLLIIDGIRKFREVVAGAEGWPKVLICCFKYFYKIVVYVQKIPQRNWILTVVS